MDIEENLVSSFARVLGRAKELFAWTPIFLDCKVPEYISDDDVLHSASKNSVGPQQGGDDLVVDSDVEAVSDTIFDDNLASPVNSVCQSSEKEGEQQSVDLFGLYDLLKKHPKGTVNESDPSLSHLPGFTLEASRQVDDPIDEGIDTGFVKESSPSVHSKDMNNFEEVHVKEVSKGNSEFRHSHNHTCGSILEVLDDMVWVSQSMGYDMDGLSHKTKKEWVKELNLQHKVNFLALQETKMGRFTHMDVNFIWGNSNYQFVSSDSFSNSGGIICIWEATVFKKAYVSIFDNFIAIYGTWISNNSKVLIVVVYAPQSLALKRALWEWMVLMLWWNMLGIPSLIWTVTGAAKSIKENLTDIEKNLDRGNVSDELLLKIMNFTRQLLEIKQMEAKDWVQKSKIKWAIEGDENSKYFHGIINKKRSQLSIRGVLADGHWKTDPENCGVNKSPGPDGFTFEFFRRYWSFIGPDFCSAIDCFFESGNFPMGSNASFIALIPKVMDAKFVTNFRPISLIGCVYKVVTKILANRLATKQAMIFKVDFAKAYDSVRWDYLLDVLHAFGFGSNWCKWIRGTFSSFMASVLVNGNPSLKFPFFCGLKQGDPLAPYLFILIMESLHISLSRATSAGVFNGIRINDLMVISHLFYADDAIFMEEWSDSNMANIVKILRCFFLVSGLKINIQKSQILEVGVHRNHVSRAALLIGCTVMQTPFRYLGLTLLKSVLGATPLYNMSIYKVPIDHSDRKISWVSWEKVMASKQNGGLGVSSFYALKWALLLKWVWHFISQDRSLWYQVIQALYGSSFDLHSVHFSSLWCSILRETYALIPKEKDKDSMVGSKLGPLSVDVSFRRPVHDGAERQQWSELCEILEPVILSSSKDIWTCDLNGDGEFRIKEVRSVLDNIFLPSANVSKLLVRLPVASPSTYLQLLSR
nr:RNA-directed DNA polymerase, eukaryota [Tanacetum cinerariifolium]